MFGLAVMTVAVGLFTVSFQHRFAFEKIPEDDYYQSLPTLSEENVLEKYNQSWGVEVCVFRCSAVGGNRCAAVLYNSRSPRECVLLSTLARTIEPTYILFGQRSAIPVTAVVERDAGRSVDGGTSALSAVGSSRASRGAAGETYTAYSFGQSRPNDGQSTAAGGYITNPPDSLSAFNASYENILTADATSLSGGSPPPQYSRLLNTTNSELSSGLSANISTVYEHASTVTSSVTASSPDIQWLSAPNCIITDGREQSSSQDMVTTSSAYACRLACISRWSSCSVFAFHSNLSKCMISDMNFYGDWTAVSTSSPGWISYYQFRAGDDKLLFKASRGTGIDIGEAFLNFNIPANASASPNETARDSLCRCNLRSGAVDNWTLFPWKKIKLVLADAGGVTLKYLDFDALSSTPSTFFSQHRILQSSWFDLELPEASSLFDIRAPTKDKQGRYFIIQKGPHTTCNRDDGWMMITGTRDGCKYDQAPPPQFAYSAGAGSSALPDFAMADVFLIYGSL